MGVAASKVPKIVRAVNKKASFDVAVDSTYEAGLVLTGDEIKSIRANRIQLQGSYVRVIGGELVLIGAHLSMAKNPERTRKLLLKMNEIEEIKKALNTKGRVAVPLRMYLKRGWAKMAVGVGTGRKQYDKRELLKNRDIERDMHQLAQ
jgi:SsrA-binding protein